LIKFWILFLWIGLSQSIFVLPSGASAKEGLFAQTDIESRKIEFLLREVEQLKEAKFWRNESSYSPKQAADHLHMKWKKAGSAIKTSRDFIEKIASKSSMSGKPYEIEFDNGTKVEAKTFLFQKLAMWKE
jgi:hypothetical protein